MLSFNGSVVDLRARLDVSQTRCNVVLSSWMLRFLHRVNGARPPRIDGRTRRCVYRTLIMCSTSNSPLSLGPGILCYLAEAHAWLRQVNDVH